jgi:hypothetical protein
VYSNHRCTVIYDHHLTISYLVGAFTGRSADFTLEYTVHVAGSTAEWVDRIRAIGD